MFRYPTGIFILLTGGRKCCFTLEAVRILPSGILTSHFGILTSVLTSFDAKFILVLLHSKPNIVTSVSTEKAKHQGRGEGGGVLLQIWKI